MSTTTETAAARSAGSALADRYASARWLIDVGLNLLLLGARPRLVRHLPVRWIDDPRRLGGRLLAGLLEQLLL